MLDLKSHVSPAQSIAPAAYTATTNGADVDLANFDAAVFIVDIGVVTANDLVLTFEEADDDGSGSPDSYATIAAAKLDGSIPTLLTTNDETIVTVGYIGGKRWVRAVVTDGGTGDGILSVTVLRGKGRYLT